MTQTTSHPIRSHLICAGIVTAALFTGIAGMASAGAPGSYDDMPAMNSVVLISPENTAQPALDLSPAELRNAISIRMDEAAEQGFDVDRAAFDRVGLEPVTNPRFVDANPAR